MRSDMTHVVTERPRHGSRASSDKTHRKLHKDEFDLDDHGPARAPCRMTDKEFSDLLGPLRGYLRKQVGRPWNKVYSELSQHLDKRSVSGRHIWTHVGFEVEVELHAVMGANKKIFHEPRFGRVLPITGLYVHPVNGLLCQGPARRRYRYEKPTDPDAIELDSLNKLEKRDGVWYHIERKKVVTYRDVWRRVDAFDPHSELEKFTIFDKDTFPLVRKRQLGTKELRERGLNNSPAQVPASRRERRRLAIDKLRAG